MWKTFDKRRQSKLASNDLNRPKLNSCELPPGNITAKRSQPSYLKNHMGSSLITPEVLSSNLVMPEPHRSQNPRLLILRDIYLEKTQVESPNDSKVILKQLDGFTPRFTSSSQDHSQESYHRLSKCELDAIATWKNNKKDNSAIKNVSNVSYHHSTSINNDYISPVNQPGPFAVDESFSKFTLEKRFDVSKPTPTSTTSFTLEQEKSVASPSVENNSIDILIEHIRSELKALALKKDFMDLKQSVAELQYQRTLDLQEQLLLTHEQQLRDKEILNQICLLKYQLDCFIRIDRPAEPDSPDTEYSYYDDITCHCEQSNAHRCKSRSSPGWSPNDHEYTQENYSPFIYDKIPMSREIESPDLYHTQRYRGDSEHDCSTKLKLKTRYHNDDDVYMAKPPFIGEQLFRTYHQYPYNNYY